MGRCEVWELGASPTRPGRFLDKASGFIQQQVLTFLFYLSLQVIVVTLYSVDIPMNNLALYC